MNLKLSRNGLILSLSYVAVLVLVFLENHYSPNCVGVTNVPCFGLTEIITPVLVMPVAFISYALMQNYGYSFYGHDTLLAQILGGLANFVILYFIGSHYYGWLLRHVNKKWLAVTLCILSVVLFMSLFIIYLLFNI